MPETAAAKTSTAGVRLIEVQGCDVWRIRSWNAATREGAESHKLAGLLLSAEAGTTVLGPMRVIFIAPGEWLVVTPKLVLPGLVDGMAAAAVASGLALVDVTEGLTILEIRGPGARRVLASGCGLDLHPSAFRRDQAARTRLAQVPVLVDCREDDCFELYVARSLASYLRSWLVDAAN